LAKINDAIEHIYGESANVAKEVFKERLDEFKKIGFPIKERARFYSELPIYLEQYQNYCVDMNDKLA